MAVIYRAELRPGKIELISSWLESRPWSAGGPWEQVATYRFDDPAGEVGIETFILRSADGVELHVPLTYRGAALEDAESFLLGTMEHSVLGRRWVYDACGDPVYAQVLAATIVSGGREAEQYVEEDGRRTLLEGSARVWATGDTPYGTHPLGEDTSSAEDAVATISTADHTLHVLRRAEARLPEEREALLKGAWSAHPNGTPLASITHRA